MRRLGAQAIGERLEIESFGENVGVLTREVFGLEVTNSGFYNMLNKSTHPQTSYEDVLTKFNFQLGMEARSIVRALIANKNNESQG